jgi:hypothetical protein
VPSPGNKAILPGGHDTQHSRIGRDFRNLRNSTTTTDPLEHPPETPDPTVGGDGHNDAVDLDQNTAVDLGRIAWLGTVLVCLVVVLILVLQGYYGYAGVTFAVALAAGINLL